MGTLLILADSRHRCGSSLQASLPFLQQVTHCKLPVYEWVGGCEDIHVVEDEDGTYYVNYSTWNGHRDAMLVATSEDLIHWRKHGPGFSKFAPERVWGTRSGVIVTRREGDRLIATRIGGKYIMYMSHRCLLAESENLIDWKPLDKTVWPGVVPNLYDGGTHEGGAIALDTPKGILLSYNAGSTGAADVPHGIWSLGQALIDRRDLTTVLHRLDRPYLRPQLAWEQTGFTAKPAIVSNALIHFKGEWLLYYGGADHHIGLATCRSDDNALLTARAARRSFH